MNEDQLSKIVPTDGILDIGSSMANKLGVQPNVLKNSFVRGVLVPFIKDQAVRIAHEKGIEIKNNDYSVLGRQALSSIHKLVTKEFGQIHIDGKRYKTNQLNKLFKNIKDRKPFLDSDVLAVHSTANKEARDLAALGFSETGEKQAAFYDQIDVFRDQLELRLSNARGPTQERHAFAQFDKRMQNLFKNNRNWLGRNNHYDPNMVDTYGWTDGSSRQGYLDWQKKVYVQGQNEARAIARDYGINFDAGHALALGKYHMPKEEYDSYSIDLKQLIRDGGEPDPKNEGGWILRGTNSASNLAVEIAKINQAKKNFSPRTIEELLELNIAFTKTGSLQEYQLRNDHSFRKHTDFSRAFRSLLSHSNADDINAVLSRAENQLLETGIQPADQYKIKGRQGDVLKDTTKGGPIKTSKIEQQLSKPQSLVPGISPNLMSIGPDTFNKADKAVRNVGRVLPGAKQAVAGIEAIEGVVEGDPIKAASGAFGALSSTKISPLNKVMNEVWVPQLAGAKK